MLNEWFKRKQFSFQSYMAYGYDKNGNYVGKSYLAAAPWKRVLEHLERSKRDGELRCQRYVFPVTFDVYRLEEYGRKEVLVKKGLNRFARIDMV